MYIDKGFFECELDGVVDLLYEVLFGFSTSL